MRVRRLVGTAAIAIALSTVAATTASAAARTVHRVQGESRYDTAAQLSAEAFDPHPDVAYVTTGDNFPDALSAAPAAAKGKGPVLLVRQDAIPQTVQTELHRVHPDKIIVVGGLDAVSQRVQEKLLDTNYTNGTVTRIAGGDRYDTAAQVSKATFAPGVPVVYVATGEAFADALSGAAAAGAQGGPILLVHQNSIPASTAAELDRLNPAAIVVLGGVGAISSSVETSMKTYSSTVGRRGGNDRFETAALVSKASFPKGAKIAYLATGLDFPDALAGSAAAALTPAPMLLTTQGCLPLSTSTELDRAQTTELIVMGGTGAVSDAAANGSSVCNVGGLPTTG